MKNTFILTIAILTIGGTVMTSCKKHVTEHEENFPHSNVKSLEVTVAQNEWIGDGGGYEVTRTLSILSSEIATNGAVMCYWKTNGEYFAMPLTYSSGTYVSHMLFTHSSSTVTFISYDDDNLSPNPGLQTFKVVAISHTGMIQNPNLDLTDYKAVKKAFHLVD